MRNAPNGGPDRRKPDHIRNLSFIANGLMIAATIVSITVAVDKSHYANVNSVRIDGLVGIVDGMKDVDSGLLNQIVELRGRQTADTALLNEKINNITNLLQEIKAIVKR
jgi:hypothetical protein